MENFEKWDGLIPDDPKLEEALYKFDVNQYKKDMNSLKEITNSIINNNPIHAKGSTLNPDGTYTSFNYEKRKKFTDELSKFHNNVDDPISPFGEDGLPLSSNEFWNKINKQKMDNKKGDSKFQKEIDEMLDYSGDKANTNYVEKEIVNMINDKRKETVEVTKPSILQDLEKLNLYRVFAISDNKFNCAYLDFIEETKENLVKTDEYKVIEDKLLNRLKFETYPTISVKLFSAMGRTKEQYIDVIDKNIDCAIKDFINEKFVEKVKILADKNKENAPLNMKRDFILSEEKERTVKIPNKINMISNYLITKGRRGAASFVFSSKKNIDIIIESMCGNHYKQSNTYIYNKPINTNLNFIVNDSLGDTVIVGRNPKDDEVGIKLVVNINTLNNYVYSDDDIEGVSLSFDFFDFGTHPEYNYFSFEMK